ncbi:MAG TPA: HAMP domain-containing sensor histidine kinase [Candidatus Lustribacter sp.]
MTRRLTYGARLTLACTALVAIAVLLLGTVAFVTVRFALESAFQIRLETTVKAIRAIVEVKHGKLADLDGEDLVQFHTLIGQGLNGAVLRRDGSLVSSNLAAPPTATLAALAASAANDITRIDDGSIAYVLLPVAERGVRYGTIVAWSSRRVYDDAERITLLALGVAGVIVIAAAALAGGALTRRMLRPVTELSAMISEIEATDLGERVAWDGPDDELGRLCTTFDRLLDRLETAFERERRFIADASHELRTPLSVMRAEVELALMHERTPAAYAAALQRLQRETQRLETLAQNLILTARDDTGMEGATRLPIGDVAARATTRMQPLATSRKLALTCASATPALVTANADMLERAIVALIDNALRFAHGSVDVRVASTAENATVAVTDDGPGFSETALREATGRFWRDDPARSGTGSGLGLAIARSIVERHGGTIGLRNAAGGAGAVVVLTVPAIQPVSP